MDDKIGKIAESLGGVIEEILLTDIEVIDRYRKDVGDLNELKLSLKEKGQLQNIVVCSNPGEGKPYKLLAGGRRFAAMTQLEWSSCRALIFPNELDECERLEIEWEENSRRKDLDWREDTALKCRILELRSARLGPKTSTAKDAPGASIRNTAESLNISPALLSKDVALARAQSAAPQLFEDCKTKEDARKVLKAALEGMRRSETAQRVELDSQMNIRLQSILGRFMIGDFFEESKKLPDNSIDFMEIDPPYAISLMNVKMVHGAKYNSQSYNEVSAEEYPTFLENIISTAWRLMPDHSFGIIWYGPDPWIQILPQIIRKAGFETTLLSGKWVKPAGQCHHPEKYLANACEEFLYFWKGEPRIVRQGHTNIFPYQPTSVAKKWHPTQRPIELMQEILSIFCHEGSRILVPFLGSGITVLAAESLGLKAFGWELSEEYKEGFTVEANRLFGGKE